MRALRNGIILYETLWILSAIISPQYPFSGVPGLLSWISTIVSIIGIPVVIWKSRHHGIMKYVVFIHGLLGLTGIISPLALPMCFYNYLGVNGKPIPDSPSGIYEWTEVVFVAFWFRYLSTYKNLRDPIIYLSSMFLILSSVPWDRVMSVLDVKEYMESCTQTDDHIGVKIVATEPVIIEARVDIMKVDVAIPPPHSPTITRGKVDGRTPKSPRCTEWQYVDLYGSIQGPFTREQMSAWYKAGFLQDDLRISRCGKYTFKTIREEFPPDTVPFD